MIGGTSKVLTLQKTVAQRGGGERAEDMVRIDQGLAHLTTMRRALQAEFRRSGNNHWGDLTDVKALSDSLDVGVCLFCDGLQRGGQDILYNVCHQRGNFPYFLAIWWSEPTHFRVAEVRMNSVDAFRSFRPRDTLPAPLRRHYDACNPKAPVGRGDMPDIS